MTSAEHRENAPSNLQISAITISDSLSDSEEGKENDKSGKIIKEKLREKDHKIEYTSIIPDESKEIRDELQKSVKNPEIDAVITTGGTGITSQDKTVDVAKKIFEKEMPGFGELLRRKSYKEIQTAVILSRSTAGIAGKTPIFCLPGSPNSVKTGMDLIIPDLAHIVKHARE